jgi:hypothetical protein
LTLSVRAACVSFLQAFCALFFCAMPGTTFILSDENVNILGMRVLTSGIDLSAFKKNPIMLYAHQRPWDGKNVLPIGKWENIRQDGTQLLADAVLDDDGTDEFATAISGKVKKGIINTASAHLDIVEWSEDPALMLPGQTLPTVTKSKLKEGSLTDLPGNTNCTKLSYQGKEVRLTGGEQDQDELRKLFEPTNPPVMKNLIAKLNSSSLGIQLTDNANEAELMVAFDKVLSKHSELSVQLAAKEGELTQLKQDKEAAEAQAKVDKCIALVDGAVKENKILAGSKEHYLKLASLDFDTTEKLLKNMPVYKSVSAQLTAGEGNDAAALAAKYDEMHKKGTLAALKLSNWDEYAVLHEAKFNTKPKK